MGAVLTINDVKQREESDTPLLLFECLLPSGDYERFSTQTITFNGNVFSPRVLKHNLFDFQLSSDDATDAIAQISVTLANADAYLSEVDANIGWKGTQLTVFFLFVDLVTKTVTTESTVLFRGVAGDPDEITEESLRLTFANKLALQRVGLPDIRIQRLCPWIFPVTAAQREEAAGSDRYSRFTRCGYSADIAGGKGTLNAGQVYTSCDHTRGNCEQRGMFNKDAQGQITSRFGGMEFVPSSTLVRTTGDKNTHLSPVIDNSAKFNDYVPMVYGTGWLNAPVIFARNDGNLTHMEVLLGAGRIDSVLKVVVSDIEIPLGIDGVDMTATGWYNVITLGAAQGAFNLDFVDSSHQPLGDPYGSMAVLSVVVPNRINEGKTLPRVQVLLQGLHLDRYQADGSFLDTTFTNNPAWVILDVLRRVGWSLSEINMASVVRSATFCSELIATTDLNGNQIHVPRFQCNLILTKRRSAAEVIRGVRVSCGLMLRYGANGLLELLPETSLALQQPEAPDGTNSVASLDGGWPAYEFSDSSDQFSGIARDKDAKSTVRILAKGIAEISNRLSVEFQDEANEYQQDALSLVDDSDIALVGCEIGAVSTALGLPNFNQAVRVLRRQLDKLIHGNFFVDFVTSFRALKIRPGDIITLTYLRENLVRAPLRVVKLSPSANYRTVHVVAQGHDDSWYSDTLTNEPARGRQPGAIIGLPRPLLGTSFDQNGQTQFSVVEETALRTDGGATTSLKVDFTLPTRPSPAAPTLPLLSLSPVVKDTDGTLPGSSNFYYAVSAVDSDGNESALSFIVRAATSSTGNTNAITLSSLSFAAAAAGFHVYRGTTPQLLYRIASNQTISDQFTDNGLTTLPIGPTDASFDHAVFYYRLELAGPLLATSAATRLLTNSDLNATPHIYSGMTVRIIDGTGVGQERIITDNDAATLTISQAWSVLPDATSVFAITESAWRFGAISSTSPCQFEVPNQMGTVVQISGRGANTQNQEGSVELCPITRWIVGGGAGNQLDSDVAGVPRYNLAVSGQGNLTVSQVGFDNLLNTRSVDAGALELIYVNEIAPANNVSVAAAIDVNGTTIPFQGNAAAAGSVLQISQELMIVLGINAEGSSYSVVRGAFGSAVSNHSVGDVILTLFKQTVVIPFARDFFENPTSQNFAHVVHLPDARVAASQFYVSNIKGDSQSAIQCYLSEPDGGLRTCSGGQFSIQVGGLLAVQKNAAPPLVVESTHAVRDIRATVSEAPADTVLKLELRQNGTLYCPVEISPGQTVSSILSGKDLGPLTAGSVLTLDITQVGQAWQNSPGRDLTVTIRL